MLMYLSCGSTFLRRVGPEPQQKTTTTKKRLLTAGSIKDVSHLKESDTGGIHAYLLFFLFLTFKRVIDAVVVCFSIPVVSFVCVCVHEDRNATLNSRCGEHARKGRVQKNIFYSSQICLLLAQLT